MGSISGAGTIKVSGDVTSNDLSVGGTVYVSLVGSTNQVLTGTGVLKNLNVSKVGGNVLLPTDFNLVGGKLTGGGLIQNTGGKLNFGNGVFAAYMVDFTGTIDDVEINISNNTLTLQSDLVINKTLTITTVGSINGAGTIKVSGDVTSNDTSVGGTVYVSMEGSMDQVLTGTGVLKNLNVSQTVGSSVLLPSNFNLVVGTLTGDGLIKNDGGKLNFGNGVFASYTVNFTGTIDDVEINISNNTLTLQSDLVINNTLTITTVGSISGAGTIKVSGDVTSNDLSYGGNAFVSLVSGINQNLTGTGVLNNLDISKTGGDVLMGGFNKNFTLVTVSAGQWDVLNNTVAASGGFTAQGGLITGAGTLNGNVTVNNAGTLGGTVFINGNVIANTGGTINPGASPGCMTINGNLTLNSGSTFFVEIDGDTPCTEHDQTIVNGTVSINGATLGGITSTVPTSIIKIIDNNLTDGIGGIKFAGAPEGSCVLIGTQSYLISYLGGDGNDVTLSPFIPEINVAGNATSIPDGDVTPDVLDDTDFGNVSVGTTHDHTFTIQNLGTGTLNLTGGTIVSISGDPEFTIQTQPLTSSIANGGPDLTFVVQFSPTTIGSRTATISISNDDCDEDPYTFVVQAEGIIPGAALDFDSVDDLVNIGSDLVLDNLSSFTVEAWINPRTMGETSQGRILDKGEVTFYVASALPTVNNILIGNVGYSGGLANYHSVNNTIVTGSWAHVAMVHDATTKTTRLYYNGTEVSYSIATAGSGTRNDDSALDMTIGNAVTTTRTFDGGIDEVRIWNRILCQPEIQNNMNCELAGNETGLVAYYQFNQGIAGGSNPTETTLDDLTANNNDGTLTSFALTGPTSNWVEPGGVVSGTSCTPFVDNTNPSITCPSNQTVNANASCQASLSNFVPSTTASDNCTANPVITQSPAPGSTLVLGPNTIIMTATDAAGNTGTCSFIVTVVDNTNPSISCPADIIVSNDNGLCGATVIYSTPSGTDNCSGQTTTQSAGLASSAFYPVGTTTNTFLVTDAAGNTATCSFTVTVNDNENPVITCPANITQTADPGVCEAVVTYNVSSSDNCPGEMIMQTAGLASGSAFPVGTTTNSFTVTDASGNTAICSFDVTVNDNENPVITCPANITQTADPGVCEAVVTYSVSSSDNCPGETIMQTVGLASGSAFPVGTTTNSFTVTDASGNTAICSFDVTVNDNENPSITCPADISVNNDPGMCEASVTIAVPIISDNCDDDGNALNFGPIINDYVDLNSPLIPLNANDPFSISLWVRTTNAEGIILSQYFDATNNNRWILRVQSGLLKYDKVDELNIPTTFVVNDGNWHHIAVTRNNTSNVTIYFDNEPVVTGIDNLGFLNHDTWLGATLSQTNGINSFDGELDEIHFWNYARSASEIQAEKNGNLIGNESGLIASYTFDQGNACSNNVGLTNLTDQTGTNDGSLIDFNLTGGLADPCSSNWTFGAFSAPITLINDYTNIEDASAFYPVGATIVTWTATDASGNTATCDITVTVIDNEDPTITCPANITQTADPGVCEAVVTYSVSSTDNCPGETIMQTAGLASGSAFPIGTTTNIFKVTDASGNTATCSFDVTVNDNENPSITCPGDIVVNNDAGVCEAVVTYSVSSTDNCPGETIMQTAGLASGSAFPIGTTTNIFKVTDASGNTATCSFDVTVNDNENPSITCPGDIVVNNDPGVCEAVVTYSVSSSDNCPGETIMQTAGLASGSAFPIGTTTNIFKVTDASGNTATCSFDVTVNDNENPSITCPGDIVVNNDAGECEAVVTYSVSSSDNCPGETIMQTAGLASGSAFPIGTTTNIFKVTDASGNTATCSFDVTVNDNENPSITCPGDIVVNNDAGVCEAVVTYSVSSSDNCPGETIMQTAGLASGSAFPVGTTTNIFKVTDTSGNTAICSFDVTVNDNENPVITCPANITQTANPGVCEAVVAYSVSSSDNCPGETIMQTAGLASGSAFPLGTTTNSFKVTDASGNTAICSFDVTVNDNENPVITCPANITQTADAGVCEAVVTYSVSSSDNCPGETIMQTVGLASGSAFPVGTTTNSFTVTDASGNTAICSFDVTVNDNENPSITCPADIMVNNDPGECEADVTVPLPVANDNCTALGGGLNFGGAPEYVNLGPISALNNSLTATFEACIKLNVALNQFTRSTIIGRDARFEFQVDVNGVGLRINNGMEFFAPITVTPGVWYQLAAVYDNGNITIYADGVNIGTMTQGSPILGLSNDVALGARTGGVKSVNGVLDEVRIWSIARTQAEIQSTRTTPLNGNEAGLVGYWAMEDGTGSTTVTDVTGNGNDGTLTNMDPATDWVEGHAFPPTVVNDYNGTGDASDTYPVGATTVTWTATDAAGNQSTCQHTVTVNDTEDPTITCPADIAVNTDSGVCGAVVTYTTPVGTDNCPGATTTQTAGVGSGATFPVGTTTETYLVTDAAGNTATCSFTVTVTDAEVPTALCQDITVQLDASGNAIITAAQIDNGSNDACGIASLALDDNSFDCSDIDIPAFQEYGEVNVTHTGGIATYTITESDLINWGTFSGCGAVPTRVWSSSGLEGWTWTDNLAAGTVVTSVEVNLSFDFSATGATRPFFLNGVNEGTSPGPNDGINCASVVKTFTLPPTNYIVGGLNTFSWDFIPFTYVLITGSVISSTGVPVVLTVTDNNGNVSNCNALVTVEDNIAPSALCQNLTIQLDASGNASITPAQVDNGSTDNCSVDNLSLDITAFACADVGANTVTLTVTDPSGNSSTCTATITVEDNIDPTITCPADVSVSTDAGVCEATGVNLGTPTTGDNCPGENASNDAPAAFPAGTTVVTWTVTDASGNTATCTQNVTVTDDEDPTITCPADVSVSADAGVCQATGVSLGTPTTSDNCPGESASNDAPASFPVGTTVVTWTVTDAAGNTATCTQNVTVTDTEDPTITCPADIAVNTDSGVCGAVVTYTTPVGTDNCPGATTTQTAGVGSGATFPVGTTTETYLVTDAAGNTATCSFTVTVTDAEAPTALCQDITVQLDASGNAIITAAQIDNGSNDACGIASLSLR